MLADDDWEADCMADTRRAAAYMRGEIERFEVPAESGIHPIVRDTLRAPPPDWMTELERDLEDVA